MSLGREPLIVSHPVTKVVPMNDNAKLLEIVQVLYCDAVKDRARNTHHAREGKHNARSEANQGTRMTPVTSSIDPKETGVRILLSVLFALITVVVVMLLGALMVFMLLFTLVTKRPPADEVRHFANRTLSYLYRVLRYVTYNDSVVPFPFSNLPDEIEPCGSFTHHENGAATASHDQPLPYSQL
jgi:Domain of unknown function (DUF4389)